jgi:ASCH domain
MASDDLPVLELAFPGPERDSGVAAILAGEKTALTGLLQIHEHAGEPIPQPGQRFSVLDSAGQPTAVIELTEVRVVPISMVDDDYARAEGRGYADAAEWQSSRRVLRQPGRGRVPRRYARDRRRHACGDRAVPVDQARRW